MTDIQRMSVVLVGRPGSLLVVHNFSEKAKQEIRDKQGKKAKQAKAQRQPQVECDAARYVDAHGRESVLVTSIKKALITAATAMDNLTKVALRQALFVEPTVDGASMLVPIETLTGAPAVGVMREDAVTIGMNTRGLAYRPEYREWQLRVTIEYNTRLISDIQLLALAEHAGWGVGIGEGRPERTSALGWGRFSVQRTDQ